MDNTLPQISASKIKTWQTCGRKYYFTYINKPEQKREKKSVGGLLGTVLHRIIEAKYKNPELDHIVLYQEKMLALLDEWQKAQHDITGEQWFAKNIKDGRDILRNFDWARFNPTELELYFSIPFPTEDSFCTLIGYIDMISDDCVIDHKSQKEIETADEMANNAQFILYRYVFHVLYGYYPKAVMWNDLRSNRLINTNVEIDYELKLNKLIFDVKRMLNATEYNKIELSDTCRKLCSFYTLCWEDGEVVKQT